MCESFALFVRQPSGVPLLVLSYALLWFTVLPPLTHTASSAPG